MKELSCVVCGVLIDLFICVFLDHRKQELRVQELEKERDALKDELLQLAAKYDVKLMKLEKEVIDTKADRDTAIQQQASSNIKVKQLEKENNKQIADHKLQLSQLEMQQDHVTDETTKRKKDLDMKAKMLEKEKDDVRKERDAIKEQLSKLKAECDVKVKQIEREKTELIETNQKQVKQLEVLNDIIQHTKSGLRFITAPEQGKSDDVMILAVSVIN